MSEWKPGWVVTAMGPVRLERGQRWVYAEILDLEVIATSSNGETGLRPDPQQAEAIFPLVEGIFKGTTRVSRDCPFVWVERTASVYQAGDFLCHEGWDLWRRMSLK